MIFFGKGSRQDHAGEDVIAGADTSENNGIAIRVIDRGKGVRSDIIKNLFCIDDNKYTIGTKGEKGTGLGLIVCKEFAKMNNGDVILESTSEQGSVFCVLLQQGLAPQYKNIEYTRDKKPKATEDPENKSTKNKDDNILMGNSLLVVEDNKVVREHVAGLFKDVIEVYQMDDGDNGWLQAIEIIPDIIISDIDMPGVDGFEFCKRIKSDVRTSHIPFLFLTALDTDTAEYKGLNLGAEHFIVKPFKSEVLRQKVINLLQLRHKILVKAQKNFFISDPQEFVENQRDKKFIKDIFHLTIENIQKENFGADDLAMLINFSRRQLYNKLKGLLGLSPTQYIQNIRLKKAIELLIKADLDISEIAYQTGFSDPSYFSKLFKMHFKQTPGQYRKQYSNKYL